MSDIYMIRHGQASFSSENYDRLSRLGCLQSEILGEYLSHIGIFFDAIYSGSLERQRHTAERVLERMPADARCDLQIQPGLNEYDAKGIVTAQVPAMIRDDPKLAVDLERMEERRSFQRIFEGAMRRWLSGRYDAEGIEPWKAFRDRVQHVERSGSPPERGDGQLLAGTHDPFREAVPSTEVGTARWLAGPRSYRSSRSVRSI